MKTSLILVTTLLCGPTFATECIRTPHCDCFESTEREYQCRSPENNLIVVKTDMSKYVEMHCETDSPEYEFAESLYPTFNAHEVGGLSILYCSNLNHTLKTALKKFNLRKLKRFTVERKMMEPLVITKDVLSGMESLEALSISYSALTVDRDFLENTPNLLRLFLNKNDVDSLDYYFSNVPNLMLLDLAQNQITSLPDGVFQNLSSLEKLQLWNNNLTGLTKNAFRGLHKLQLLELSSNHIETIDPDAFASLPNLISLSLRYNRLSAIDSRIFRSNSKMENVRLSYNEKLVLPDHLFANLTNLRIVNLESSKITSLPDNLFEGCSSLEEIMLNHNELTSLSAELFAHIKSLKRLDVSQNRLNVLPDSIFASLEQLLVLNLRGNNLTVLGNRAFDGLVRLRKINLSNNNIVKIGLKAFSSFENNLKTMDLSYNRWDMTTDILDTTAVNSCVGLEELILHHNNITDFPGILMGVMPRLKKLDVSFNRIETLPVDSFMKKTDFKIDVDVSNNKLMRIDFNYAEELAIINTKENYDALYYGSGSDTVVNIGDNPLLCDCHNYDLFRYFSGDIRPEVKTLVQIIDSRLYCSNFEHPILAKDLRPLMWMCPVQNEKSCPKGCHCTYRPYDLAVVVNCSRSDMSSYPVLHLETSYKYNQTICDFSGNKLTAGPDDALNYDNVTVLDLSENAIEEIYWIPPSLEVLSLRNNSLTMLNSSFIEVMRNVSTLRKLSLDHNRWTCDCRATDLKGYLMEVYLKVGLPEVQCHGSRTRLIKLTLEDICPQSVYLTVVLPLLLSLLFAFAVAVALYYRYQTEIKIYLYAKNLCLWFVTEEELDKDKTYDVFISFAHQDETFVIEKLLPEIEHGDHRFKTCIHFRDWIPGEFITTQIVNSVKNSRRTLVVLSNEFLDSVWGKMEFRTAHTEALSEGRARVIVLIYGDLDESKLDDELKSYLKTNTYVKWGDRYFWNKLKYALPHSKGNFYEKNKRHAKVMLKIDDKFKLMTPTTPTNTSTPPITLDPGLLKCKEVAVSVHPVEGERPLLVKQ